ncbi:unnamed protein product [Meganyctiphanes norvegica]|uniref:Glycosyltransferase family 92 protein n=1 Tax=Meganyctiphanes norvegica TaxID=48144 RepID=A0AAV2PYF9_MEGNR
MRGFSINLFSAFYDKRKAFRGNAFVRILSIMKKLEKWPNLFCQMWFHKGKITTSKASVHLIRYYNKSTIFTHMVYCEVPLNEIDEVPLAVSLVTDRDAHANNLLRVMNNEPIDGHKKDFAVCHKGLDFPFYDISIKLVEWLELLNILGVSKVFFYEFNVHPNISRVLQYYTLRGRVEVIPLTLPGTQPTEPKELHDFLMKNYKDQLSQEKLPYNDCFYRNINKFKYIVNLDLDEILIPRKGQTWQELIDKINKNHKNKGQQLPDSYEIQRVISLDKFRSSHENDPRIPSYMYMLQNVYLLNNYTGGPKSVISTERTITVKTHKVERCQKRCVHFKVPEDTAHIVHFRKSCKGSKDTSCTTGISVKNIEIWKYKKDLIKQTTEVLIKLKLI